MPQCESCPATPLAGRRGVCDALVLEIGGKAKAAARHLHPDNAIVGSNTGIVPGISRARRLIRAIVNDMIFDSEGERGNARDFVKRSCQRAIKCTYHVGKPFR